jgi:hypothetical protein
MKTDSYIIERRARHHKALATLSTDPKADGLKLWRSLRKIENAFSSVSVAYCNGDANDKQWEAAKDKAKAAVLKTLGKFPDGFMLNSDPRGYALKLRGPEAGYKGATMPEGIEKDMGGNGLLAPEIN